MTPIRQEAEMPPRDYSEHLEHWMEPREKPRKTAALVIAYAALAIASLVMAASFANLAFKLHAGG